MNAKPNPFLITAAALSALAAAAHIGCIIFGAPWYRFLGAGEKMAQMAIAGLWYPTIVTLAISAVLIVWSLYALSAAGVIRRLPLLRTAMCMITGFYLLRGTIVLPFMELFPGRSSTFWWWSSGICFTIGLVHLVGLKQVWPRLSPQR